MKRSRLHAPALALFLLLQGVGGAAAQEAGSPRRRLVFSGLVEADIASDYGSLDQVSHASGLRADLNTHVLLNPNLYAVVRTTMRDGTVPRQGAGSTWSPLAFDGAQINWKTGETILMAGDLRAGAGYFQYYRYKHTAAIVGEHSVRGAGFRHGEILVHAGTATDTVGGAGDVSVFARWKRPIGKDITWSPAMRYTLGVPGASPFELGVSFEGSFEGMLEVGGHVGMTYWNNDVDPGNVILFESRYSYEPYFLASTFFFSDKGEVPSGNAPRNTTTRVLLDDFLLHVEPGMSLDKTFSVGLPLEYRNISFNSNRDEELWMIPTLYVYPAPRAQWWLWAGLSKPLINGPGSGPRVSLGSEIILTF